jgi:hypothetical protein
MRAFYFFRWPSKSRFVFSLTFFFPTCKLGRRKTAKAHDCMHAIFSMSHVVLTCILLVPWACMSVVRLCRGHRLLSETPTSAHSIRQANASFAVAVVESGECRWKTLGRRAVKRDARTHALVRRSGSGVSFLHVRGAARTVLAVEALSHRIGRNRTGTPIHTTTPAQVDWAAHPLPMSRCSESS